ncbi:MAG: tRNA 2-thiouridine(34) synthase MnmA [Deltaproteobacteria bacterium]|nr:tRNA 2-thiouridine(34) synthase MnmA [Deltaproteobacteria bacterium]
MKGIIAVAVSGGIDSLVAAYILKKEGRQITGLHFKTGYETKSAKESIDIIAKQLDISIITIDCAKEFKSKVVDYFTKTYLAGKTPNPCMVCNQLIKFGTILSCAREIGASSLATGHYARIIKDNNGSLHLLKSVDKIKDQSYFLARLTQEQLSAAMFPLGNFTKTEVKNMAKRAGLQAVVNNESQDICFIKGKTYGNFLTAQTGYKAKTGDIVNGSGNVIGKHNGLHLFTIGQRRGINCPAPKPYYVVGIDPEHNRLTVGSSLDLLSTGLKAININWIIQPPDSAISVDTRIRGRHVPVPSKLYPTGRETAEIIFEKPQSAVTPGQGAVFYKGNEVLGSGWIEKL